VALCGRVRNSYAGGVRLAAVSQPAPRRGWLRAGNMLLVVLVTALQVAAPQSGSTAPRLRHRDAGCGCGLPADPALR